MNKSSNIDVLAEALFVINKRAKICRDVQRELSAIIYQGKNEEREEMSNLLMTELNKNNVYDDLLKYKSKDFYKIEMDEYYSQLKNIYKEQKYDESIIERIENRYDDFIKGKIEEYEDYSSDLCFMDYEDDKDYFENQIMQEKVNQDEIKEKISDLRKSKNKCFNFLNDLVDEKIILYTIKTAVLEKLNIKPCKFHTKDGLVLEMYEIGRFKFHTICESSELEVNRLEEMTEKPAVPLEILDVTLTLDESITILKDYLPADFNYKKDLKEHKKNIDNNACDEEEMDYYYDDGEYEQEDYYDKDEYYN
ncbi:MAG: hypothetical protein PHX08_06730 [Lachnospiraceae bacterium]|nr:hypothetical protein [Lachnospiraceae bacterium]